MPVVAFIRSKSYQYYLAKNVKITMSSQLQNLQKQLLQLQQEASVQRIPVSQAVDEILKFTNQHAHDDALVIGLAQSENPFKDAKGCFIL